MKYEIKTAFIQSAWNFISVAINATLMSIFMYIKIRDALAFKIGVPFALFMLFMGGMKIIPYTNDISGIKKSALIAEHVWGQLLSAIVAYCTLIYVSVIGSLVVLFAMVLETIVFLILPKRHRLFKKSRASDKKNK